MNKAKKTSPLLLRLATLVAGAGLLFGGCDPTLQSTLENGVINVSTSFLTSLLQATINVASNTNTNG